MATNTYILQKDLPDAKAGTKFFYDELGKYYHTHGKSGVYQKDAVEGNVEWFLSEGANDYTKSWGAFMKITFKEDVITFFFEKLGSLNIDGSRLKKLLKIYVDDPNIENLHGKWTEEDMKDLIEYIISIRNKPDLTWATYDGKQFLFEQFLRTRCKEK